MKGRRRNLFLVPAMASVLCFGAGGAVCAKPLPLESYLSVNVNVNLTLDIDINVETSFNDIAGIYTGNLNTYGNAGTLIWRNSAAELLR